MMNDHNNTMPHPPDPHTSCPPTLTLADTHSDVPAVTSVWNWFLLRWFSCSFMAPRLRRRLFGLAASTSLSTPTPLRPKDATLLQSLKMLHQYILLNNPYYFFFILVCGPPLEENIKNFLQGRIWSTIFGFPASFLFFKTIVGETQEKKMTPRSNRRCQRLKADL